MGRMEEKHKHRIKASFKKLVQYKEILVLDIPDDYKFMDEELIEIFENIGNQYIYQT